MNAQRSKNTIKVTEVSFRVKLGFLIIHIYFSTSTQAVHTKPSCHKNCGFRKYVTNLKMLIMCNTNTNIDKYINIYLISSFNSSFSVLLSSLNLELKLH